MRSSSTGNSGRILVVDDNEDNRFTLQMLLELNGHDDVTMAADGFEALELLGREHFDLVLLDIMMPRLSGYDVLEQLRREQRLHTLPVIMISALSETDSVVRCIELGAEDYLPKPFNPVLLKARIGACLEKKRLRDDIARHIARIESELRTARELQLGMLPTVFPSPSAELPVDLFAYMRAAREIGGDLYDFFTGRDGAFYFLIGDVSDKGVPAALFMARTKSLVRLIVDLTATPDVSPISPSDIVSRVNRDLCEGNASFMFVTLLLCVLDPGSGDLRYCNAGHTDGKLIRAGGAMESLDGPKGRPVGIDVRSEYRSARLGLSPGDTIFIYTDGITEATGAADELYGDARLVAALSTPAQGARAVVEAVNADVEAFIGEAPPFDDIATLALRYRPG